MPLSERARVEAYLPNVPKLAYQRLLATFEQEFTYSFGGCTVLRGAEGHYLSRLGLHVRDPINIIYTDMPLTLERDFSLVSQYGESLQSAAIDALQEEAVLIVVMRVYHVD